MHTIDLEPYQYSATNITGIRLVDVENPLMELATRTLEDEETHRNRYMDQEEDESGNRKRKVWVKWNEFRSKFSRIGSVITPKEITVQSALIFDGVLLLAEAFKQFETDQVRSKKMDCRSDDAWESGNSISNFARNVNVFS